MKKTVKTNVARLLDKAGLQYETVPYTVDESDLSAVHVAEQLGEDIRCVFKTLVLAAGPSQHFVCVIPGDAEVDLKKAARAAGVKKAEMLPLKELQPLTGYIRGGCSPIGMKRPLPTFFDESALRHPHIYVSAGIRGLQLKIAPADIIGYVGAATAPLTKDTID